MCRLLYVKEVELIPSTAGMGPALPAPLGQTELPACPVCLERLDEHISGIATTVYHIKLATAMIQRAASSLPLQAVPWPWQFTNSRQSAHSARPWLARHCAGVQPPLSQRVLAALGGHELSCLPLLLPKQQCRLQMLHLQYVTGDRTSQMCLGSAHISAGGPAATSQSLMLTFG